MTFLLVRKLLDLVGIGPTPDEKESRSRSFVTSSRCSVVRWRDRGSPLPIVSCWQRSRDSCLASVGPPSSLRPQR
jgi:hypothetical protein